MDDAAVHQRLDRIDQLLDRLEAVASPTGESAMEVIGLLTEVYGEALARIMGHVGQAPDIPEALAGDELIGHLLALHQVHPHPVERRVEQALAEIGPYVQSKGGEVSLEGISDDVARVRLSSGGCPSCSSSTGGSQEDMEETVRDVVLAAAPELAWVEAVAAAGSSALIPVASLVRKTAPAPGSSPVPGTAPVPDTAVVGGQ